MREYPWLARITEVPSRFRHTVHAYHGIDVWDRAGERLLYAGFDELGHFHIVVQDEASGEEWVVGTTIVGDYHTACKQRWILDDTAVVFAGKGADGAPCPIVAPIDDPAAASPLSGLRHCSLRHVVGHGDTAYGTRWQPGQDAAIIRANLAAGTFETLFTAEEIRAAVPTDLLPAASGFRCTHPVPSPDQAWMFFKVIEWLPEGRKQFAAFLTADLVNGRLFCHGKRISGHPFWLPDARRILNVRSPQDGSDNRHLVTVDAATGDWERLIDLPIEGPGHPSISPDGRYLATDAFTADGDAAPIYCVDLETLVAREICRLDHAFKPIAGVYGAENITRAQPHPVWSPCSTRLAINFNHAGTHLRLQVLDNFRWS